jgi:hypothetical protein
LRQAQTNPTLDEAERAAVVNLYTQAIQQLELARQCAAVAAQHDVQRAKAPELLRAVQAELEHPPELNVPDVPADAPLPQIEAALAEIEADLQRARLAENELLAMQDRWLRRRLELPNEQTVAQQHLTELVEERPDGAQQASGVELARRTLLQARHFALETEIQRYQKELLTYAAYRGLFKTRLELAERRVAALESLATKWRDRVQQQRSRDAEQELEDTRARAAQAPSVVRGLAEESLQCRAARGRHRSDSRRRLRPHW